MSTTEYRYTKDDFESLKQICLRYKTTRSRISEAKMVFPWAISFEDVLFVASLIDKIDLGENPFEGEQFPVQRRIVEKEGSD